ncbi:MAG TPA: formyltetrahydrofolate deformylase [Terriglobia bacterium]
MAAFGSNRDVDALARGRSTAVLLISSPDRKGLVARISDFIFSHGGNILHADHHVDAEAGLFLMRIEWDLEGFDLGRNEIASRFEGLARELNLRWRLQFTDDVPRSAILVSKQDHCLCDLLLRRRAGELNVDFSLVISNHPDHASVARYFEAEYLVLPVTSETKPAQEAQILSALAERKIQLVVLARYMQILSDAFVREFPERILNIHHSFLPAFIGPRPYHRAYERGVKLVGATAHYVTSDLDDGPIIAQDVVRISHRDSVGDLIRKGRDVEKMVLARAVRLHLEHRVLVYGNKTAVFD